MSEAAEHDSKTEEASEKRIREAVEKGNVPVSREAAAFTSLTALLLASGLFFRPAAQRLFETLSRMLDDSGGWEFRRSGDATSFFVANVSATSIFVGPLLGLIVLLGLAASFAQNPPRIVPDRLMPDWSRISPVSGWRRLFGFKGQIEFGKAAFKILALGLILGLLIRSEQQAAVDMLYGDPRDVPDRLFSVILRLLSATALAAGMLLAADLVWSRMSWRRDLRMTKQELKDEHREIEGDPAVKARRRSISLNRTRKRMMAAVPKATVVIANPTHYAIALRYQREEGGVPLVVAKGQDLVALRIRAIAEENGIPVIENKPLARSLYDAVQIDQAIPPLFYRAIAEIINYLQSRGRATAA